MAYYKNIFTLLALVLVIFGCSSDDESGPLQLVVTDFQTSNDAVKLTWKLNRPNTIIVQDLKIYRMATNMAGEFLQFEQIANLPSNETTFTDHEVPFKSQVSYKVYITYFDQSDNNPGPNQLFLESDLQVYARPLVTFPKVPLQIKQDPMQIGMYHILGNTPTTGYLKKYHSALDQVSNSRSFENGSAITNNFHIANNEIFVADAQGKIFRINASDYDVNANYNVNITDHLNAFAMDGDRIYYQDDEIWKYYGIGSGISTNTGIATTMDYAETLDDNTFLFLYAQAGGSAAAVYGYNPQNCNANSCFPAFIDDMNGHFPPIHSIDPHIFSWNATKQKFISGFNGSVFNLTTLQPEVRLKDITGKRYFNFAFDSAGNIYGTVQGEKIIHKFNSNYELVATIQTKLFPFFVMVNTNGIQTLGTYEPQEYWGFYYGYEFAFHTECAIEKL